MESGKKRDLAALAFIPLVMTLANSMLVPVLPQIEKSLRINDLKSSMIITVYSIASIVLIPVAGFLSDKFGRKKVMVPSLIITGAGGLLSGLSALWFQNPYGWILAGRILQGIGASGAFPVVIPCVGTCSGMKPMSAKGLASLKPPTPSERC
ncbi:MAG TPA: MFS transporter [Thermoclostridium caenicola]|nr:MFS transporter [Thermoclostridium caenicola]